MQHKEAEVDGTVISLLPVVRQECCTLSASIWKCSIPALLTGCGTAQCLTPPCQRKVRKAVGRWTVRKQNTRRGECYIVNTLKSLVEKFYRKILLVIYMEICDLGYWTKCSQERVNGYRKILAAPLRNVLLCYALLWLLQSEKRLSELSSYLAKTFSSFFF